MNSTTQLMRKRTIRCAEVQPLPAYEWANNENQNVRTHRNNLRFSK
jgi:hypothetical protein